MLGCAFFYLSHSLVRFSFSESMFVWVYVWICAHFSMCISFARTLLIITVDLQNPHTWFTFIRSYKYIIDRKQYTCRLDTDNLLFFTYKHIIGFLCWPICPINFLQRKHLPRASHTHTWTQRHATVTEEQMQKLLQNRFVLFFPIAKKSQLNNGDGKKLTITIMKLCAVAFFVCFIWHDEKKIYLEWTFCAHLLSDDTFVCLVIYNLRLSTSTHHFQNYFPRIEKTKFLIEKK